MKQTTVFAGILLVFLGILNADSWATRTAMPTARYYHVTGYANNRIYAIGGSGITTNEEYDPVFDSWTSRTSMPTARWWGFAAGVVSDKIYAIGGAEPGDYLDINEEYTPSTDSWTTKAPMPTPRFGMGIGVYGDKLYVIGGYNSSGVLAACEEYDPNTDSWTSKTPMPSARYRLAVGVVEDKIYAIGGYNAGLGGYLAVVEEYDPVNDIWTSKSSMPTARSEFAIGTMYDKIYAIGGYIDGEIATNEEYDPSTDSWTTKTSMPTARWGLAVSSIAGTSKIYAIGGGTGAGALAVNEEYSPDLVEIAENRNYHNEISISPTIIRDKICLQFNAQIDKSVRITLFNAVGRVVLKEEITNMPRSVTIEGTRVKNLNPGVYFLTVATNACRYKQIKLIKL